MPRFSSVFDSLFCCRIPSMPNDYSSLLSWERAWEKAFASIYGIGGDNPSRRWRDLRAAYEDCNGRFGQLSPEEMLGDPARGAAFEIELMDAFARRDFERQWRAYTHLERRDIILQGLCRTAEMAGPDCSFTGMNRLYCPDASLRHLADRDGEGFLELAKSLLPSDIDALGTETIHISHPIIDRMLETSIQHSQGPNGGPWDRLINHTRATYLTGLVIEIFRVVHAEAPQKIVTCTTHHFKRKFSEYDIPARSGDSPVTQGLKMFFKDFKSTTTKPACVFCLKRKNALPTHHAYKRCARCAKIDKEVLYCSRECQISHWKEGQPPHKEVCGRTEREILTAAGRSAVLPPAPWLPKADPGYKRSPALMYQLSALRRDRALDYVIFDAEPENDVAVRTLEGTEHARARRVQFLVLRNRAFRSADPDAVRTLFALLCERLRADIGDDAEHVLRMQKLRRQLESEYGVDVGEVPMSLFAVPEPTPEDVEELLRLEGAGGMP